MHYYLNKNNADKAGKGECINEIKKEVHGMHTGSGNDLWISNGVCAAENPSLTKDITVTEPGILLKAKSGGNRFLSGNSGERSGRCGNDPSG